MAEIEQDGRPTRGARADRSQRDRESADRLSRFFAVRPRVDGRAGRGAKLLRRGLPVFTVLLLLLVFAWPLINTQTGSITLSYSELKTGGEEIRLQNARYTGSDVRDRPFEVSAKLAVQEGVNADRALLTGVRAEIEAAADDMVTVTAGEGIFRRGEDRLVLDGGINLRSDSGYMLSVERADVDLAAGVARGVSPVSGEAPFGAFSADGFTLDTKKRSLQLEGRVKVRLEPEGMQTENAREAEE